MKKTRVGKICLGSPHSLIIGHYPEGWDMKMIGERFAAERKDVTSMGFWDNASPNFANYYPDLDVEDLQPDLDEASFIYPIYRALSEVIVHKEWNPIDFSQNGVLKAAMNLLVGQTVYANHEMVVGNELGAIPEVSWQEGYTTNSGVVVPAGINAKLKIDGKANPKVARNMMMKPPAIHSVSVTVSFEWEPSHTFTSDGDFWRLLGTYAEDGEMVRRIVTKVKAFHEISTVAHGADPFAQKIDDNGEIVNPEYANIIANSTEASLEKPKNFFFDYRTDLVENSAKKETTPSKSNDKDDNVMNKHLITLCALFSISVEGLTDEKAVEELSSKIKGLNEAELWDQKKVDDLIAAAVKPKDDKITELESDITKLKDGAPAILKEVKDEVVGLLNKLHENNPPAALVTSLESQDISGLKALRDSYEAQLEQKMPLSCESCGSHSVSRRSSKPTPDAPDTTKNKKEEKPTKNIQSSVEAFRASADKSTRGFMDGSED